MFIKSYQQFESVTSSDIMSKKNQIEEKWDLRVEMRHGSSKIIDIFIRIDEDGCMLHPAHWVPRAIYNMESKEFVLFYRTMDSKPLKRDKWIKLKSDDFFDSLDNVVGYLYYDV
jgi:hypothetical protein